MFRIENGVCENNNPCTGGDKEKKSIHYRVWAEIFYTSLLEKFHKPVSK